MSTLKLIAAGLLGAVAAALVAVLLLAGTPANAHTVCPRPRPSIPRTFTGFPPCPPGMFCANRVGAR